jgi:deoxycytidylate deaminase
MCREERFIRRALKESLKANNTQDYQIGAVLAQGSRIISTGCCSSKSHPQNPKLQNPTKRRNLCAEVLAILRALHSAHVHNISDMNIYVARQTKTGERTMAKPCLYCQKLLSRLQVRKVFFTNWEGKIESLELRDLPPLSREAQEARKPQPPEELIEALQNPIHLDSGKLLFSKPAKTKRPHV